jgi:hypothetical protein
MPDRGCQCQDPGDDAAGVRPPCRFQVNVSFQVKLPLKVQLTDSMTCRSGPGRCCPARLASPLRTAPGLGLVTLGSTRMFSAVTAGLASLLLGRSGSYLGNNP